MNRVIILFLAVTVVGYFGWRKWKESKHSPAQVGFDFSKSEEATPQKTNLKDKNLHQAFAKILAKEKTAKKKKNRTIDELIQYNLETGSVDMTQEEMKLVIAKLQSDVSSFGGVITALHAADQTEKAQEYETKLEQKREQLENFLHLHRELSKEN